MTTMMRARVRAMRAAKSDAERKLWRALRDLNRQGCHFRQQAPIGRYIADFCDHSRKLIVEVDGSQHAEPAVRASDARRTAWLQSQGYEVLRFWNVEVLTKLEGVVTTIMLASGLLNASDQAPFHDTEPIDSIVPPPLWGRTGGGEPQISQVGIPPTLTLPARGRGPVAGVAALLFFSIVGNLLFASPAFASEGLGGAVDPFFYRLMVFVMAIFVGYYVVWSVTPALHTPLMSVTNAISSVIVVGALLAVGVTLVTAGGTLAKVFGFLALAMASVNIFGGFLVTQRMLGMYKKKDKPKA